MFVVERAAACSAGQSRPTGAPTSEQMQNEGKGEVKRSIRRRIRRSSEDPEAGRKEEIEMRE